MSARSFAVLASCAVAALAACSPSEPAPEGERVGAGQEPIIGGIVDRFRTYVVGVGDANGAFCTGTLVSRRTVITAGHCFQGIQRVFFGTYLSANAPSVDVANKVRHPGFSNNSLANDLTMVELVADAPSQPVPLLRETLDNTPSYIGPPFTFVGYGVDEQNNWDTRRVVTFPIAAVGPANVGLDTGTGPIDETMFFYAVANKNTCSGDSGGPAFLPRGRVEYTVGATSFGDPWCEIDGVDARTDQPMIDSFIQDLIDQFEGTDPCRNDGVCDESCNTGPDLVDPDCAANHCDADGICALSCVAPPDPDCADAGVDHCQPDGVCDPSCAADLDCEGVGGSGAGGSGAGGTGAVGAGGAGAVGPGGSAGGPAGGGAPANDARIEELEVSCSCRTVGSRTGAAGGLAALGLALAFAARRRRR